MRAVHRAIAALLSLPSLLAGCSHSSEPARETPAERGSDSTDAAEPIRLPFAGQTGSADFEYVFVETLASGGLVTYQRWWGRPDRPGPPIARVRVRSAMFGGAGGATPIYVSDDGDQRVFRSEPGYQANLIFHGCTDAEVDGVLAGTEVTLMAPLGTAMPEAASVCVGPADALRRVRAVPSRAGAFAPDMPIQGEHLNWMVEGVGCVTYPALSGVATCDGASLPWVAPTLCQQ